jgi:hypothetical protein
MYVKKILSKNSDPEYYNKEVKQFEVKVKVRKMYNKKIWAALPTGTETIIQGVTGMKGGSGKIFTFGLTKRRQMLDRILQVCKT